MKKQVLFTIISVCLNCAVFFGQEKPLYTFVDGNNNSYKITPDSIIYEPINCGMSSSGVYSGGDPKTVITDSLLHEEIKLLIMSAINKKEDHMKKRIMSSGLIVFYQNGVKMIAILHPDSESMKNIEAFLIELMAKKSR
ncbi:MAG: hypothetical protein ABIJ16_05755 [Bacteroidota bacterium]